MSKAIIKKIRKNLKGKEEKLERLNVLLFGILVFVVIFSINLWRLDGGT